MRNQCTCGFPDTHGMTHRLGEPCLLTDGKAMLNRTEDALVIPAGTTIPDATWVPTEHSAGEVVQRAIEQSEAYERRIANMTQVIHNLSGNRDKLVRLRAAVDQVINEVEAVAAKSTNTTAQQNYGIITAFLRKAADAAAD